jgi:fructokinase
MKSLAFGEILWDVIDGKEHIGGAPFNLSAHLARMGTEAAIVSSLGKDGRGERAMEILKSMGLRSSFVKINEDLPTGVVLVEIDGAGKPTYDIKEGVAWDRIELGDEQIEEIRGETWDVLVCGSLAQRTEYNRKSLRALLEAAAPREVFFDVNLRLDYFSAAILKETMERTSILKLNDEEVPVVSGLVLGKELKDREFCEAIESEWGIHTTAITRGGQGASVYQGDRYVHVPAAPVDVVDTVGAGDSFSAAFLYGLHKTGDILKAAEFAVKLSSFVAGSQGALPPYSGEILETLSRLQ